MNEVWLGETLTARVSTKGPRPLQEVVKTMSSVARAVGRAHVQKRGHGGITPDAVVFYRRPLSRVARIELLAPQAVRRAATHAWSAPEAIVREAALSPAVDVWSFGLLGYFALTGRTYFEAPDTVSLLREIMVLPLASASQRAAESGAAFRLFEGFDGWFARCVDRDPARRFASAPQAAASFVVRAREGAPGACMAEGPAPRAAPGPARASSRGGSRLTVAA
jgi:eukaryotic-like serine/threonine-protein kinase